MSSVLCFFQEDEVQKLQERQSLSAPSLAQRSSKSDLSSTSSFSVLGPQPPTDSTLTPPVYITDTVTPSPCKSSASRKSKRKFPDFRCRVSVSFFCLRCGIIISWYLSHITWFSSFIDSLSAIADVWLFEERRWSAILLVALFPDTFNDYSFFLFSVAFESLSAEEEVRKTARGPRTTGVISHVHKKTKWSSLSLVLPCTKSPVSPVSPVFMQFMNKKECKINARSLKKEKYCKFLFNLELY